MKIGISTILITLTIIFASNSVFANPIVAAYTCKLKEGKKKEEVQAINIKWVKWVNEHVNKDITSSVGTAVVGNQNIFMFVDTYPDLNVWAAATTALDSEAASELEDMFSTVSDCSENSLWKFEASE